MESTIHKANVDILVKNIYKFLEQAYIIANPTSEESINLMRNLRNDYVLPKTLVNSLDKALKRYTEQELWSILPEQSISEIEYWVEHVLDQGQTHVTDDVVGVVGDDPDKLLQSIE